MSLSYNCWFASPPPDLHQVLDQLTDNYMEDNAFDSDDDEFMFFLERDGTFYLYLNVQDTYYNNGATLLLTFYPNSTGFLGEQHLPVGELQVNYAWYLVEGKSGGDKVDEARARLLGILLQHYAGDFASLFQGETLTLCRLAGQVYLNQSSGLASGPLLALLELDSYKVGEYPHL